MAGTGYLAAVRESYDTVAAACVRLVTAPDAMEPASRSMLAAFAELVRAPGLAPVADLGCGPGRVTACLAGLGLPAFGLDLSHSYLLPPDASPCCWPGRPHRQRAAGVAAAAGGPGQAAAGLPAGPQTGLNP
jgi:hypothetical protein